MKVSSQGEDGVVAVIAVAADAPPFQGTSYNTTITWQVNIDYFMPYGQTPDCQRRLSRLQISGLAFGLGDEHISSHTYGIGVILALRRGMRQRILQPWPCRGKGNRKLHPHQYPMPIDFGVVIRPQ